MNELLQGWLSIYSAVLIHTLLSVILITIRLKLEKLELGKQVSKLIHCFKKKKKKSLAPLPVNFVE